MKIGTIIQTLCPDFVALQEVTPHICQIFSKFKWFEQLRYWFDFLFYFLFDFLFGKKN